MPIQKAVITAAGPDQTHLPLQTIVSSSGEAKPMLALLLDDVVSAGIRSVAIIIAPGTEDDFRSAAGSHAEKVTFIEQKQPRGFAHAVSCARDFTGDDRFLLLLGDHIYLNPLGDSCIAQLLKAADETEGPVSAVQPTAESYLPYYGTIGGKRVPGSQTLIKVTNALEKPTPTVAEQELIIPGLRSGKYLCYFGMHVLTPGVMAQIESDVTASPNEKLPLTPSLNAVVQTEDYLACQLVGQRFNLGSSYGLLRANLGMALAGRDRDEVMTSIIELIASTK